jgi:O-antigen ligase
MTGLARQPWTVTKFSRERCALLADGLAAALVVSLPWSTSATGILAGLWFVALLPTLDISSLRRVAATPAGGIPVLLWALGLVGTLWAFGVPMDERWEGVKSLSRLLVIPLLMSQFRHSERGSWVLIGFLISCTVLLVLSWLVFLVPQGPWPLAKRGVTLGVPVKDYIAQAIEFTASAFLIAPIALKAWREQRRWFATALWLLAMAFLANVAYVANSRTALILVPVLLLLFACKQFAWRGMLALMLGVAVAVALIWSFDAAFRGNITNMLQEVSVFRSSGESTRAGERLEYWRKSIGFVADAPLIGHGTGSIRDQFRRSVAGETGMAALASSNPHNQTFVVAIQLGLVGIAGLFAMWLSHFLFFRGEGLVAWAGLVVVTQNIVGSLFNSHLSDFTQGWGYVIGVGVAAGMVLKQRQGR